MRPQELAIVTAFHPDWSLRRRGEFFGVTRQAVHDMLNRGCKRKCAQGEERGGPASELREMSDIEAAYIGALVDTDGCVPHVSERYWYVFFDNTEIELVANVLRITGVGRVHYRPRERYKDMWCWGVCRKRDVMALMQRLRPYSLKIQRALEKIDTPIP